MRTLTLRQLRVVAAIARTGRVLGAADELGVTAPAITQQLKELEARFELPLFERARDGMRPTAAGHAMVDAAARVEAVLLASRDEIDALRGLRRGVIAVGVTRTAKYFAPAVLGAFKRLNPEIEIKLSVGNREEAIRAVAALEVDLAVMGLPPDGLDVTSVVIGDHPFVVVAAPAHPLAARRRIPIAELADESFVTREPGSGTRDLMSRVFDAAGLRPRAGMEASSNETIKQAVMAGLGVAFISAHTVAAEVKTGRLAVLDVVGLPALRQWRVVRHADKRLMPAAAALWSFFEREGHAFLPTLPDLARSGPAGG